MCGKFPQGVGGYIPAPAPFHSLNSNTTNIPKSTRNRRSIHLKKLSISQGKQLFLLSNPPIYIQSKFSAHCFLYHLLITIAVDGYNLFFFSILSFSRYITIYSIILSHDNYHFPSTSNFLHSYDHDSTSTQVTVYKQFPTNPAGPQS